MRDSLHVRSIFDPMKRVLGFLHFAFWVHAINTLTCQWSTEKGHADPKTSTLVHLDLTGNFSKA
jgi:hypothetical protein